VHGSEVEDLSGDGSILKQANSDRKSTVVFLDELKSNSLNIMEREKKLRSKVNALERQLAMVQASPHDIRGTMELVQEVGRIASHSGRRGGDAGLTSEGEFAMSSGNRAGNSEDDEEEQLGTVADDGESSSVTKFQKAEARTLANHITAAWVSKKGESECKRLIPDNKVKGAQWKNTFITKLSAQQATSDRMEETFKDLGGKSIPIPSGLSGQHVVLHRSGVHVVTVPGVTPKEGFSANAVLCAAWTAVCTKTMPSQGQECVTSRRVLKCGKGWGDTGWEDCTDWGSDAKIALPGYA